MNCPPEQGVGNPRKVLRPVTEKFTSATPSLTLRTTARRQRLWGWPAEAWHYDATSHFVAGQPYSSLDAGTGGLGGIRAEIWQGQRPQSFLCTYVARRRRGYDRNAESEYKSALAGDRFRLTKFGKPSPKFSAAWQNGRRKRWRFSRPLAERKQHPAELAKYGAHHEAGRRARVRLRYPLR